MTWDLTKDGRCPHCDARAKQAVNGNWMSSDYPNDPTKHTCRRMEIADLTKELAESRAAVERLAGQLADCRVILREGEWSSSELVTETDGSQTGEREMCCPSCHWIGRHDPTCALVKALGSAPH
jgi:hypothetical protein